MSNKIEENDENNNLQHIYNPQQDDVDTENNRNDNPVILLISQKTKLSFEVIVKRERDVNTLLDQICNDEDYELVSNFYLVKITTLYFTFGARHLIRHI